MKHFFTALLLFLSAIVCTAQSNSWSFSLVTGMEYEFFNRKKAADYIEGTDTFLGDITVQARPTLGGGVRAQYSIGKNWFVHTAVIAEARKMKIILDEPFYAGGTTAWLETKQTYKLISGYVLGGRQFNINQRLNVSIAMGTCVSYLHKGYWEVQYIGGDTQVNPIKLSNGRKYYWSPTLSSELDFTINNRLSASIKVRARHYSNTHTLPPVHSNWLFGAQVGLNFYFSDKLKPIYNLNLIQS